jgi:hypothetical protein
MNLSIAYTSRGRYLRILLGLAFVSFGAANAIGQSDPLFRVVPIDDATGFELGRGYDILTGSPRGDCVERTVVQNNTSFGPNSVSMRSARTESSEQLDKFLNISASASASFGAYGGSASASYTNSLSVSKYSLTYAVDVSVVRKGDSIRDASLKSKYSVLLKSGKDDAIRRFHDLCGDGFIDEMQIGGRFQALIQIHTNSQSDAESVAASLSGSFGGVASGSASLAQSLKQVSQSHEVKIWTFQKGGSGPIPLTPDELASRAAAIPDLVKVAPNPIGVAIFSYTTILDDLTLPVDDFAARESTILQLSSLMNSAKDQQADAQYIFDHPSEFDSTPADIPKLATEIMQLKAYQNDIAKLASDCLDSSGECGDIDLPIPPPTARPARR